MAEANWTITHEDEDEEQAEAEQEPVKRKAGEPIKTDDGIHREKKGALRTEDLDMEKIEREQMKQRQGPKKRGK